MDGTPVKVQVGALLKLRSMHGVGSDVTVKGEHAHTAPEVFTALHRGALIVYAKVQMDLGGNVLSGTLKAESLTLNGVKLPKAEMKDSGVVVEKGEQAGATRKWIAPASPRKRSCSSYGDVGYGTECRRQMV